MHNNLEKKLDNWLSNSPAQLFFHHRSSRRLTVLAYHGVNDPACFEEQLRYLVRNMHPVSLSEILGAVRGRHQLPERAVLLTFDDGERSVLEQGCALLTQYNVPAVVFVVTGLLNTQLPYWWVEVKHLVRAGAIPTGCPKEDPEAVARYLKVIPDEQRVTIIDNLRKQTKRKPVLAQPQLQAAELRVMESLGIAIGNHTETHPCLDHCPAEKIRTELVQSHDALCKILGHPPVAFAYPNGNIDSNAESILHELGYEVAFLFDHRVSSLYPENCYRISRVRVDSNTHLARFKTIVSGLHSAIHYGIGRC